MPANYELNIDHQVIEVAAWDVVTFGDVEDYLEGVATLPNDLGKAIEYLDLDEAKEVVICPLGALQLCRSYEKLVDRGLRGCVIYAPDDFSYEIGRMLISTFSSVCGDLPEGYRLTRRPLAIENVRTFLHGQPEITLQPERVEPIRTPQPLLLPGRRRQSLRDRQKASPSTFLPS